MTAASIRLARIAIRVASGERVHDADATWLIDALAEGLITAADQSNRKTRLDRRDNAIREALGSYRVPATRSAKMLALDLGRYLATTWRDAAGVEQIDGATEQQKTLHLIATLNDGRALAYRQILNIAGNRRGRSKSATTAVDVARPNAEI